MKNMFVLMMLVLSLGVVVAHDNEYKVLYGHDSSPIRDDPTGPGEPEKFSKTYYFEKDLKIISKTVLVDYRNDKRFSTMEYRHGYSYRSTENYFEKKYSDVFYKKKSYGLNLYEKKYAKNYYGKSYSDSGLRYSYKYIPYLKSYDKRECYVNPPRDKLFYIKC